MREREWDRDRRVCDEGCCVSGTHGSVGSDIIGSAGTEKRVFAWGLAADFGIHPERAALCNEHRGDRGGWSAVVRQEFERF